MTRTATTAVCLTAFALFACSSDGGTGPTPMPMQMLPPEMVAVGGGGASAIAETGGGGAVANAGTDVGGQAGSAGEMATAGAGGREIVSGDGPPSSRQSERPLGTTDAAQGYYEYLPPGYGDGELKPLLLFFHGGGERGNGIDELPKLLVHGPPWLISMDQWPAERPFIVLSPQHLESVGGCPEGDEVKEFIDFALAEYDVDPKRVYLTGLSCGGFAIWRYLAKYGGGQVAATVPICGDGRPSWEIAGCTLGDSPLWAFHGDADGSVDVLGTTVTVNYLLECPAPPRAEVKMTIFPGVGHESWPPVYDLTAGHDIYSWMLGFSL